jgi:hypothetical protein
VVLEHTSSRLAWVFRPTDKEVEKISRGRNINFDYSVSNFVSKLKINITKNKRDEYKLFYLSYK